jgi:hypothetical protein
VARGRHPTNGLVQDGQQGLLIEPPHETVERGVVERLAQAQNISQLAVLG